MKISQDQWERPNPGCQRHRCSLAEPFVSSVHPATRTTQQAARQERIACHPTLQKPEKRIGKQYNGAHNREGELKSCIKKFVCVPAEKKERRSGETVQDECFSIEKETAEQNRAHYCGPHTRNVQSRHCSVKKKQGNDKRRRRLSRKPRHRRQHP